MGKIARDFGMGLGAHEADASAPARCLDASLHLCLQRSVADKDKVGAVGHGFEQRKCGLDEVERALIGLEPPDKEHHGALTRLFGRI